MPTEASTVIMFADLRHQELQAESRQARAARGSRGSDWAGRRRLAGLRETGSSLARHIAILGRMSVAAPAKERETQPV